MRVKIRPSFALYLLSIALCRSVSACVGAVCALIVHELAHLAVGWSLGERFASIEFTPFGGVMRSDSSVKGWRGALVAAAGPLGNYGAILLSVSPAVRCALGDDMTRQIVLSNAVMMGFNLLPALPLDGGRIAFDLGRGALGVTRSLRILTDLGVALGAALVALSAWGLALHGVFNLSAWIVGLYVIVCAMRSRQTMLTENLCAVIHERCARTRRPRPMRFFDVPPDTRLCELIDWMARGDAAGFIVQNESNALYLDEESVCAALLCTPEMRVGTLAVAEGRNLGVKKAEEP